MITKKKFLYLMVSIIGMVILADFIFGKAIVWYVDKHKLPGDYQKFQYIVDYNGIQNFEIDDIKVNIR